MYNIRIEIVTLIVIFQPECTEALYPAHITAAPYVCFPSHTDECAQLAWRHCGSHASPRMNADQSEEKRQRTHGRHLKTSLFPSSLLRKVIVDRYLSHTAGRSTSSNAPGRLETFSFRINNLRKIFFTTKG